MPYIPESARARLNVYAHPDNPGELNYLLTNKEFFYFDRSGVDCLYAIPVSTVRRIIKQEMP